MAAVYLPPDSRYDSDVSARQEGWERATWEGARNAVLREGASMTLREKLAWLESAHVMAERLVQAARLRRAAEPTPPATATAAKGVA